MAVILGKMNDLPLARTDDKGGFLDAGDYGEVFLPLSQVPENTAIGDCIKVFCYLDDGRLTVTAKRPKALLGELARLRVKDTTRGAAYLEWGIRKDLMVPFNEQRNEMHVDDEYIVYIAIDRENRLYGTTRYNRYISDDLSINSPLKVGDWVDLIAISKTPLGIKMVMNNSVYALLNAHEAETSDIRFGTKIRGVIQAIREDRRVSVTLHQLGQDGVKSAQDVILDALKENGGSLPYNDKSDPTIIEKEFKMSKGKFKKIIGGLYKEHLIVITNTGISLVDLNNLEQE